MVLDKVWNYINGERENKEEAQREYEIKQQQDISAEVSTCLTRTASKNDNYNKRLDGTTDNEIGPLYVKSIPYNGGDYTALVKQDIEGKKHVHLQVDINVSEDKLHLFKGPYGPDINYSINQKEDAKDRACEFVKYISVYNNVEL